MPIGEEIADKKLETPVVTKADGLVIADRRVVERVGCAADRMG